MEKDLDISTLVITRNIGESFWIGDNIFIEVTARRGQEVAFVLKLPRSIKVLRSELKKRGNYGN